MLSVPERKEQPLSRIHRTFVLAAVIAALTAACGGGDGTNGASPASPEPTATETGTAEPTPQGTPVELEVEAENFAFDESTYTVPAGSTVELKFKNRDEGVPHTFSVYTSSDAQEEIFATGNVVGDTEDEFQFAAPDPGTYYFQCDVHPNMNGDVVVE
jgi:plastocyanin